MSAYTHQMSAFVPTEVADALLLLEAILTASVTQRVWVCQQNEEWAEHSLADIQQQMEAQIHYFLAHDGAFSLDPTDIVINEVAPYDCGTRLDIDVALSERLNFKVLLRFYYGRCEGKNILTSWHIPFAPYSFRELAHLPNPYTDAGGTTLFHQVWEDIVRFVVRHDVDAQEELVTQVRACLLRLGLSPFPTPALHKTDEAHWITKFSTPLSNTVPAEQTMDDEQAQVKAELEQLEKDKKALEERTAALKRREASLAFLTK